MYVLMITTNIIQNRESLLCPLPSLNNKLIIQCVNNQIWKLKSSNIPNLKCIVLLQKVLGHLCTNDYFHIHIHKRTHDIHAWVGHMMQTNSDIA